MRFSLALPQENAHHLIDFLAMVPEIPSRTWIVALAITRADPNDQAGLGLPYLKPLTARNEPSTM